MENDLFYELLQEAFSKKIISYPLGKEEAYNQGILACKSILHDIQKRGFRNKDVVNVVRCKDCKFYTEDEKWCTWLGICGAFNENGFCSHGVRRDEDETN